jgi:polysaccharide export outer membrane protein
MKVSKLFARCGIVSIIALAGLLLGGCKTGPDPRFTDFEGVGPTNNVAPAIQDPNLDILAANDPIEIDYADLPQLPPPFKDRIKGDGSITLVLNETFMAAGKTRRQLEEEIRARYVPRKYQTMTVTVTRQPTTQFFYVDGDVKDPGQKVYLGRTTVLTAIASARGFTDFAKKSSVKLTRGDRIFVVNCKKAIKHPELDLVVYPDDKIWVPRTPW